MKYSEAENLIITGQFKPAAASFCREIHLFKEPTAVQFKEHLAVIPKVKRTKGRGAPDEAETSINKPKKS